MRSSLILIALIVTAGAIGASLLQPTQSSDETQPGTEVRVKDSEVALAQSELTRAREAPPVKSVATSEGAPASDSRPVRDFSNYSPEIGSVLAKIAAACPGEDREALDDMLELVAQHATNDTMVTNLLAYGSILLHDLWDRAPHLRAEARDLFHESEDIFTRRLLLTSMLSEEKDYEGNFDGIEYDLFEVGATTTSPALLVECLGNLCNRRNLEIHRAALDFAFEVDPRHYNATQHPGLDVVLSACTAMIALYPQDAKVQQDIVRDLENVADHNEVNIYQFRTALKMLREAGAEQAVTGILDRGLFASDLEIVDYCRQQRRG